MGGSEDEIQPPEWCIYINHGGLETGARECAGNGVTQVQAGKERAEAGGGKGHGLGDGQGGRKSIHLHVIEQGHLISAV